MAVALNDRMLGGISKRQPDISKPFDTYGAFIQNLEISFCFFPSSFLPTALHSALLYAKTRHHPV